MSDGITPFVHQRQIVNAPFTFPKRSYFFLCGGFGCGKSFSIVLMIILIVKKYNGTDITVGLCSTTITLLQKTVILDLQKICKKTGSEFNYNQKDNIITIGTIRFLLIATGQPSEIYGPNTSICLCLDGNTRVYTHDGYRPLKTIKPGEEVLTRAGWRKVTRFKKQGRKRVIAKGGLIGTPDHKIPSRGRTIELKDLDRATIFYSSKRGVRIWEQLRNASLNTSTLTVSDITDTRKAGTAVKEITSGVRAIRRYTGLYGKKLTAKFRKDLSYIIKTKTLLTILLKILTVYHAPNTQRFTALKRTVTYIRQKRLSLYVTYAERILRELLATEDILHVPENVRPLHGALLYDIWAALNTFRRYRSAGQKGMKSLARSAVRLLTHTKIMLDSVLKSAETLIHGQEDLPLHRRKDPSGLLVPYAEKRLNLKTRLVDSVHRLALIKDGYTRTVYDITVEDCHEFLTDRGYVHNCDELDELPQQKAIEAHKALSERNRITLPDGRKPFIMYFSTTHGYRGLYQIVQKLKADRLPYVLVRGLTKNNTSLDPQYVKNLYAIYDEQERLAYLEGMFVNLQSGRVYSSYDEATCKCKPFEITPDMTVYVGQDLNSGFSKACAVVKKDGVLYIVHGWSFKEIGGAPAIMRSTFHDNEILWFPDCSGKEILKGYKQEILDNRIQCRIGSANPRILDRVFYVNKLFKMGLLKVFDCKETDGLSESLKVRAFNDMGQPEKGKGEDAPDHYCDCTEYVLYRIVRSDPEFMQLRELSRENVKENGYLNIAGSNV